MNLKPINLFCFYLYADYEMLAVQIYLFLFYEKQEPEFFVFVLKLVESEVSVRVNRMLVDMFKQQYSVLKVKF